MKINRQSCSYSKHGLQGYLSRKAPSSLSFESNPQLKRIAPKYFVYLNRKKKFKINFGAFLNSNSHNSGYSAR
jgi:hypothetical protein